MKNLYNYFLVFLIALSCCAVKIKAQSNEDKKTKHHAFSNTLVLGVETGHVWAITDYSLINANFFGRGYVDYYFPTTTNGIFGLRGFASGGLLGGSKNPVNNNSVFETPIISYGIAGIYGFSIEESVFPYVSGGVSYTIFDPKDANGNKLPGNVNGVYDLNEFAYHADIGLKFLVSRDISLNLDFSTQLSSHDYWDDIENGSVNDLLFSTMLGFSYSLFTKSDSDGDSVTDEIDKCPETPKNVEVDEFGCPADNDKDGVPNYMDKCPNTPVGTKVNSEGCALDSDNDNVPDDKDLCPNTPANTAVDEFGCPDTDKDGVADNKDKCPNTPTNAPVDANGCPLDTDKDGVADYLDKCPNTPVGIEVDQNGCAKEKEVEVKTVTKKVTLSGDTNFEFDKAVLLPNAYKILEPVLETMKKDKTTRWKIEGHTDSIGSDEYNQQLSEKRAQAVIDYFIENGIDKNRFELVGSGETNPIATNSTQEGRAMNRRVEVTLVETDQESK